MQLISGIATMQSLADVVYQKDSYSGHAIAEKLQDVLENLTQIFESGKRKWNFQASLSHDAQLLYGAILKRAQVSSYNHLKDSPSLWTEEEKRTDLPLHLQQSLAFFISICQNDKPFFFPYYHHNLLQTASPPSRETVRTSAENILLDAYKKDSKGHFLIRDCSTEVLNLSGFRLFTASTINSRGEKSHFPLTYSVKKGWIINSTGECCVNLNSLMKHFMKEAVEGLPTQESDNSSY